MPDRHRDWIVLLVGGASGVGKTELSSRGARRLDVNLTEIDDFHVVLESTTTPEQQPLLQFWRTNAAEFSSWDDEQRVAHFVRVCREVFQPALEAVIGNHLETGTRTVLEGDFLLPELTACSSFAGRANDGRVLAVFVSESDESQLTLNYSRRDGQPQPERAHFSWRFNRWLRAECARHDAPVVSARPWETIVDRALAQLRFTR
jgi:2-phosphoglycerate kinase